MKICFLGSGSSVFTKIWLDYFVQKHDVSLITFQKPVNIDNRVNKYYIPKKKKTDLIKFILKSRRLIKKINPDIVYGLELSLYGFTGAMSKFHPLAVSPLGSDIAIYPDTSIIFNYTVRYTLKNADYIQVQDALSYDRVCSLGASPDKVRIKPWGVDTTVFKPMNMAKKYDVLNIHGSDFKKQNVSIFIQSIPYVKKEIPDIKYCLLGDDGKAFSLTEDLGVLDNITFHNKVPHDMMPTIFSQSNVFVDAFYPNHSHGGHAYGIALLEVMTCGTPTIAANRPTISKLKGGDKWYYGYTFEGGNPKDLARKIINLIDNKREKEKIAKKNREIVEKKFDWNKNMEKLEKEIYSKTK